MKFALCLLALLTFSAHASPFMSVKERLRLHLWVFGLEEQQQPVNVKLKKKIEIKELPEELERPLRKFS